MNGHRERLRIWPLLLLFPALFLAACGPNDPGTPPGVTRLELSAVALEMTVGDINTFQVDLEAVGSDLSDVSWVGPDAEIATFSFDETSGTATVTAVGVGVTTAKASIGAVSATVSITVVAADDGPSLHPAVLSVEVFALDKVSGTPIVPVEDEPLIIYTGDTLPLAEVVEAVDGATLDVRWEITSSGPLELLSAVIPTATDEEFATLLEPGEGEFGSVLVKALNPGLVTVTAFSEFDPGDGTDPKSGSIGLVVLEATSPSVTGVRIVGIGSSGALSMFVGDAEHLTAAVDAEDGAPDDVTWESSDPSVVTVDQNGNISAVGQGEAEITVRSTFAPDGPSATLHVTVLPGEVISVTLAPDSLNLDTGLDGSGVLTATVVVTGNASKTVTWSTPSSSFEAVVDMIVDGSTATFVNRGGANICSEITVTSVADPTKSATAMVNAYDTTPVATAVPATELHPLIAAGCVPPAL